MKANPLKKIGALGQSIWLDYIRRDLIASGELEGRRAIRHWLDCTPRNLLSHSDLLWQASPGAPFCSILSGLGVAARA